MFDKVAPQVNEGTRDFFVQLSVPVKWVAAQWTPEQVEQVTPMRHTCTTEHEMSPPGVSPTSPSLTSHTTPVPFHYPTHPPPSSTPMMKHVQIQPIIGTLTVYWTTVHTTHYRHAYYLLGTTVHTCL